ncbi:hypothetical protein Tco_0450712 [Tanacetum coccineum]
MWFSKFADLLFNFTKVQAVSPKRNLCRIHAPWQGARVQWKFQFSLHSCSLAGSTSAMKVSNWGGHLHFCEVGESSRVPATEIPAGDVATTEVPGLFSTESPESKRSMSVTSVEGSPGAIYQPGWGVTNDCRLDTLEACQDMVDHTVPPGYFSELRHLPNTEFLAQYNINMARQVALGSQLRLRFEQEVRLLKKARAQNLETLLEAEVDMKKATEARNAELAKELESLRAKFSDLELNNNQLSQQVSTLQAQ